MRLESIDNSRREQVITLRKTGLSCAEVGRRLGLSRERIRQIDKGISPKKPRLQFDVMLRPAEVALMLGVHENTVRRWANNGILKAYTIGPRGDRRFKWRDINKFLVKKPAVGRSFSPERMDDKRQR